jgi:hypothetical protein
MCCEEVQHRAHMPQIRLGRHAEPRSLRAAPPVAQAFRLPRRFDRRLDAVESRLLDERRDDRDLVRPFEQRITWRENGSSSPPVASGGTSRR